MPNRIPRLWSEGTIVCAASGPTLAAEALAAVRGRAPVVAVNDAVRLAPWADVLYSSDRHWWAHYRGMPTFAGHRVGIGSKRGDASPISGAPGILVLEHTGIEGLERRPGGLRTGQHSGYAAINLAVHLGARRILLLGYTGGIVNGRQHFFGKHPATLAQTTEAQYAAFCRAYATLAPELAALGIEVANCTPDSHIAVFPRADVREALAAAEVGAW